VGGHLHDDTSGLASVALAHHTLADLPRFEGIVEAETANVGVSANAFDTGKVLDLPSGWGGDSWSRLWDKARVRPSRRLSWVWASLGVEQEGQGNGGLFGVIQVVCVNVADQEAFNHEIFPKDGAG